MSIWYEVKDPENIDLSEDGKSVQILYNEDYNGNCYVEVPVELLTRLFGNAEEIKKEVHRLAMLPADGHEPIDGESTNPMDILFRIAELTK